MRRGTDSMRTMMLLWVRALGLLSAIHAATPAASVTPDLMWSARPLSEATIQESNSWMPVRDTNLTMRLENEAEVVISYAIAVLASRGRAGAGLDYFSNQGTSLAGGQRDFLQLRLVVNGVPYRQSSSHCSPGFSLQTAADMLSGHAAVGRQGGQRQRPREAPPGAPPGRAAMGGVARRALPPPGRPLGASGNLFFPWAYARESAQ